MNKDLSIIIPHFNSSELLKKLLSTIPQNKNIQIIVVDDRSKIEHVKFIEDLQDEYDFEFYKNKKIKSAGMCRNIGLSYAKRKWILFADADDYFTEIFYESISKYFESESDIVFFKPTSICLDTGEISDRHMGYKNILENYTSEQSLENELKVRYKMSTPWSKIIKKEFIFENNIKFDEVIASNDIMFSVKAGFYMNKFDISDNILYVVSRNKGSLTTNLCEDIFDARFQVSICRYKFLKSKLSKEDFELLYLSSEIRTYIGKSIKYGIIKVFDTLIIIRRNNINLFHYRFLNPLHLLRIIPQYRKQTKINKKYAINKKL